MRLLILGKMSGQLFTAGKIAMERGAKVVHTHSLEEALATLRAGRGGDLIIADVELDVPQLLKSLVKEHISTPVVACGIGTQSDKAVAAIKAGAKEYIPLPPDPELISAVLEAVGHEEDALLYKDATMAQVISVAEQIAPSEASVLITGESGTGKEVIARHIHQKSQRKDKAFIAVNCAAIPENLLESELFGHEKGAFTGAVARRIGKFEQAQGGTLLLDEISEMHPHLQAKLLRVIQEREIDRVGSTKPIHVDIRLLATSNKNLIEEVNKQKFRDDLYYRLNVVSLELPPLRNRPEDILILSEHFLKRFCELNQIPLRPFSEEVKQALCAYRWPGNVRELENTIHRAVLLTKGHEIGMDAIFLSHQPTSAQPLVPPKDARDTEVSKDNKTALSGSKETFVGKTVAEVERNLIMDTLGHCFGNRTHTANILGISIRTLRNKLKQYEQEGGALLTTAEEGEDREYSPQKPSKTQESKASFQKAG